MFLVNEFELGRSFLLTGKSFLLTVGLCCLRSIGLVFLLTVEIRLGLLCLWWKSVWSFLLTVPPDPEIRFGLSLLTVPPVRKLGLVFFAYGSPTVSKKDEP